MMRRFFNRFPWLRRFLLMAAVAPFVLLWGEIFTKILLPQNVDSRMNIFKSDPVLGFTYKPNAKTYEKGREYNALYQINSLGLRDREYGPKKDDIFRVLLVGDSFSVSHGLAIEESLSRQLENALQKRVDADRMPLKIEVINAASGGYSPYNYWKAYLKWTEVFSPDVVMVGISPDDYDCSNEDSQYLIEGGAILGIFKKEQGLEKRFANPIKKLRKWLSWNSEFYILMRNFFYYNDVAGRLSLLIQTKDEAQIGQLQQYVIPQPESMGQAWTKTFSYIKKLGIEAKSNGIVVIVIPVPLKLEIDQDERKQALSAAGLASHQVNMDQPLKMIKEFGNTNDMAVIDPRQGIRARHAEVSCYFVYDGHWNAEGIRVGTAYIATQWRDMGLPPW